jgi:hypothetical protein
MIQSKVAMGGIGGSVAIILVWVFKLATGIEPPEMVVQAFTTVCGFVAGYFTAHGPALIELKEVVK